MVEFDPQIAKRVRPVADVYRSHGEERPSGTDNLFYLGFAGQPFVCVHGDSGSVVQVHRDFGVRLLASSVGGFVSTLGLVRGEIGEGADPFPARLREAAMKHLREVDPDAVPGAGPAWAGLLDDIEAQLADETRTRVDR